MLERYVGFEPWDLFPLTIKCYGKCLQNYKGTIFSVAWTEKYRFEIINAVTDEPKGTIFSVISLIISTDQRYWTKRSPFSSWWTGHLRGKLKRLLISSRQQFFFTTGGTTGGGGAKVRPSLSSFLCAVPVVPETANNNRNEAKKYKVIEKIINWSHDFKPLLVFYAPPPPLSACQSMADSPQLITRLTGTQSTLINRNDKARIRKFSVKSVTHFILS